MERSADIGDAIFVISGHNFCWEVILSEICESLIFSPLAHDTKFHDQQEKVKFSTFSDFTENNIPGVVWAADHEYRIANVDKPLPRRNKSFHELIINF